MGLNEAQYRAVYHRGGPLLVLAGAGSGKTRVITERVAALVERGVAHDRITAVTFTNKAADEMRQRLRARLGATAGRLRIQTFHALGLAIVRQHAGLVGRRAGLSVFGRSEQRTAVRSVLQEMGLPDDRTQLDRVLPRLSQLKGGIAPRADPALVDLRRRYDALLIRMNAVDFDDLILLPLQLLQQHDEVAELWRMRASHLLVDEYQDSSRLQYELVRALAPGEADLTVVGDDDQAIYGWRGAEVRNLFQLERDYPTLTVVRLEENYRSTAAILHAANSLIAHNRERLGKKLRNTLGRGRPPRVWECDTSEDEAERIAADIARRHTIDRVAWERFCILYRAAHQSRAIEAALRGRAIPYRVSGGRSFFDHAEIRDLLAWMRLIANPDDDLAFLHAATHPRRGIGATSLSRLGDLAHRLDTSLLKAARDGLLEGRVSDALRGFALLIGDLEHRFRRGDAGEAFDLLLKESDLIGAIREATDDEEAWRRKEGNIAQLRDWWIEHAERKGNLVSFMQRMMLFGDRDEAEEGAVRLMTVHAAKGLEFDHVYIAGMEEGSFPHKNAVAEGRIEEERRLLYVAITRARHRLTLSWAAHRSTSRRGEARRPSRFLQEIDHEALCFVDRDPDSEEAVAEAEAHMAEIRRRLGLA
ncbi:MAG: ATP-dependent DNA helicase Rep [Zetaproteobacteria bacterium]|nr:MAG: ATP-dependent DNA helicase Rep [Zetaproteobacteria bacterium]